MLMPDVQYGIYLPSAATTKNCTVAAVSSRLRLLIAASYDLFYVVMETTRFFVSWDHRFSCIVWCSGLNKADKYIMII